MLKGAGSADLPPIPQKPRSDSESLQKFMGWKLIKIDLEVTSEVFEKFWCMINFGVDGTSSIITKIKITHY